MSRMDRGEIDFILDGLLELDSGRVKPTLQGRRFLNELLQRFLD